MEEGGEPVLKVMVFFLNKCCVVDLINANVRSGSGGFGKVTARYCEQINIERNFKVLNLRTELDVVIGGAVAV